MRVVPVYEAEGMVLCHDVTEIIPGKRKGRAFKKGHVIRKEDIPSFLPSVKKKFMCGKLTSKHCMKMKLHCALLKRQQDQDCI